MARANSTGTCTNLDHANHDLIEKGCKSKSCSNGTASIGLANVPRISPRRRLATDKLRALLNDIDERFLAVAVVAGKFCAGEFPRFPINPSGETKGLDADVVKVLHLAELLSEEGLDHLVQRLAETAEEYPRRPKTTAKMLSFCRQPAMEEA